MPEKGKPSMKKPKYSLYERIDFITQRKVIMCAAEDKAKLKKRFPLGTKIVEVAGQKPGGYRIVDMERLKEAAYKMAKTFPPITIEPVNYKNMWNTKGIKGEPIQQNVVIKIDKGQQS